MQNSGTFKLRAIVSGRTTSLFLTLNSGGYVIPRSPNLVLTLEVLANGEIVNSPLDATKLQDGKRTFGIYY